jgi:hypothetical protein
MKMERNGKTLRMSIEYWAPSHCYSASDSLSPLVVGGFLEFCKEYSNALNIFPTTVIVSECLTSALKYDSVDVIADEQQQYELLYANPQSNQDYISLRK